MAGERSDLEKEIVFRGNIFEIEHETQADGRVFEVARRAPGVRLIVANKAEQKLLLTREYRKELLADDYRLPGGKVFDKLEQYDAFRASGKDILGAASEKAKAEAAEEAGIDAQAVELYKKSTLGATVEWDLYVFEATAWQPHAAGQQLEVGEQIVTDNWFDYSDVKTMILEGHMQEERVALILLQWLAVQE